MKRVRRPLWVHRPLLCMIGWHVTSVRITSSLIPTRDGSGKYTVVQRLVSECDRKGCTHAKVVS